MRSATPATVLVTAVLAFSACGSSEPPPAPSATGPNPAPGSAFVPQAFAELPKPGSAKPLDAPLATGNTISQSYAVLAMQPEQLIEFYARVLPPLGWGLIRARARVGRLGLRSLWEHDTLSLQVTATAPDPIASNSGSTPPTQLDLVLTDTNE